MAVNEPRFIVIRENLPRSPEVFSIAATLEIPRQHALGALAEFWIWARQTGRVEGDDLVIPHADENVVDDVVDLDGFAKALESVGWLRVVATDVEVATNVPDAARWLCRDEAVKQRERDKKRRQRAKKGGVPATSPACPHSVPPSPLLDTDTDTDTEEECARNTAPSPPESGGTLPETHPVVVATNRLASMLKRSRAQVGGSGRSIGLEAARLDFGGHDPGEVVGAAFDVADRMRNGDGWGIGRARDTVLSLIRKAAEAGEIPEVYGRRDGTPATTRIEGASW